jgi:hypothetical protein
VSRILAARFCYSAPDWQLFLPLGGGSLPWRNSFFFARQRNGRLIAGGLFALDAGACFSSMCLIRQPVRKPD